MKNNLLGLAGLAVAMLVTSPAAHATLLCLNALAPGGSAANANDTCAADLATIAGSTVVASTGVQPFSIKFGTPVTNGTLEEEVLKEASGTLDFYIQLNVNNTSGPINKLGQNEGEALDVSTANFAGFLTSVGTVSSFQLLPAATLDGPSTDSRSATGSVITWAFSHPVLVNENSFTMVISTNAVTYQAGSIQLNTSDLGVGTLNGFEPLAAAPVPEPVSIILLGTTLALSAVFIRRRRASKA